MKYLSILSLIATFAAFSTGASAVNCRVTENVMPGEAPACPAQCLTQFGYACEGAENAEACKSKINVNANPNCSSCVLDKLVINCE